MDFINTCDDSFSNRWKVDFLHKDGGLLDDDDVPKQLFKAIIVDIDGTAAIGAGVKRIPYEYDKCYNDRPNYMVWKMIEKFSDTHKILFVSGRENVQFETGVSVRNEKKGIVYKYPPYVETPINNELNRHHNCFSLTYTWIDKWWEYFVSPGSLSSRGKFIIEQSKGAHDIRIPELFMRKQGDHRSDDEVKKDIYEKILKNLYTVELVIDDRNQVVNMWRDLGLSCWQVAPGDF